MTTNNNGYLIRQRDKVAFLTYQKYSLSSSVYAPAKLYHIEIEDNNFYLHYDMDNNPYTLDTAPYIIINNFIYQQTNNLGFKLNKGDVIKIGRYKFKIRAINFINKKDINNNNINNNINNNNNSCRICFSNSNFSPLICPCNCTGSMKYIHLSCLQKWLLSKKQYTTNKKFDYIIYTYTSEQVQCELCKTYFPDFYKINDNLYDIYDFHNEFSENGQKSSFTIETLLSEKNLETFIYNIVFTNIGKLGILNDINDNNFVEIKIGRTHNCEIILNDPTISKIHSTFYINIDGIYLKDYGSKYGTGVLIQSRKFNFIDEKAITIESYSEVDKKGIMFEHGYEVKKG